MLKAEQQSQFYSLKRLQPLVVGNTQSIVGLGTDCTVVPNVGGAAIAGISTRAFVGGGSTFVGLSTNPGDKEFVSFFVHYNGGTNTDANSYDILLQRTDSLDLVL